MTKEAVELRKQRIEWARERVIEAARNVSTHAHDDSYKAALTSRVKELDELDPQKPTKK